MVDLSSIKTPVSGDVPGLAADDLDLGRLLFDEADERGLGVPRTHSDPCYTKSLSVLSEASTTHALEVDVVHVRWGVHSPVPTLDRCSSGRKLSVAFAHEGASTPNRAKRHSDPGWRTHQDELSSSMSNGARRRRSAQLYSHNPRPPRRLSTENPLHSPMLEAMREVPLDALGELTYLDEGEFARVWRAKLDERTVVMKAMKKEHTADEDTARCLKHEIGLLARMRHPNVITCLATGSYNASSQFIVLPLLPAILSSILPPPEDGVPVWTRRREKLKWPTSRGLRYGSQLAAAQAYLHDMAFPGYRILHRDVKPKNIGIKADDTLVLFDFGLASLWHVDHTADANETRPLTGLTGSLRYMSPEVALSRPYSHKSEVFSFASVLFEMVAHEKPYRMLTENCFYAAIGRGDKPTDYVRRSVKKSWSPTLVDIFGGSFNLDPSARPEFRELLPRLAMALSQARLSETKLADDGVGASPKKPKGGCQLM